MTPIIEIDPQGSCFVCHSSANHSFSDDGENCEKVKSTATAFKMLLRYLKVDMKTLGLTHNIKHAPSDQVLPRGLNTASNKLSVSLCEDCSSVTNDFLELFQAFESIRLQLDLCVGQIHEFMEKGGRDPEKVRKYDGRISLGDQDVTALTNAKIVECLRKELLRKVSQRVHCSVPRISVMNCTTSQPIVEDIGDSEKSTKSENVPPTFPVEKEIVEVPKPTILEANVSSFGVIEEVQNMDVDITNDHSKEPEPTLIVSKHGNVPHSILCIYCERKFSCKSSRRTHMFSMHAFKFLPNEGRLPPTLSEQDLDNALERVLEQMKPPVFECPLCKCSNKNKSKAKYHLLRNHLGYFVESVGKTKVVIMHAKPNPPVSSENEGIVHDHNPTESWNCSPCGMCFTSQSDYYAHLVRNHHIFIH